MYQINETWRANEADVPTTFQKNALKELKYRWDFLQFPVHCATYGISPNYHTDNVFGNAKVMTGLKEVIKFFFVPPQLYNQAIRVFTAYKAH